MHSLDFISQSPRLFIFHKESNKTNFGGILFLIYLIICLAIFLYYLLDYIKNNKFETEYSFNRNVTLPNDYDDILKNDTLNPKIDGLIKLINQSTGDYLNDNFFIMKKIGNNRYYAKNKGMEFYERVSDLDFLVAYKCQKENCSIREEDRSLAYTLTFAYSTCILDHQNSTNPIFRNETLMDFQNYEFSSDYIMKKNLNWQIIKYIDKGGLFKSGKEYIGGNIKSGDILLYNKIVSEKTVFIFENDVFILLYEIKVNTPFEYYDEYIRTEVSLLTVFSNSFSLWISLYNGISFIFSFLYAKNFNNYKIIQNILSKIEGKKFKELINKEFNENNNKSENSIISPNIENNLLINDDYNEKENITEKSNDSDNESNKFEDDSLELPKLHLFDFIFNNFYCKKECICDKKKQMIISICNKMLFSYLSVENILYNQIKFEHLMKDYKWNNPELKSILRNGLITQLKSYLSDEQDN